MRIFLSLYSTIILTLLSSPASLAADPGGQNGLSIVYRKFPKVPVKEKESLHRRLGTRLVHRDIEKGVDEVVPADSEKAKDRAGLKAICNRYKVDPAVVNCRVRLLQN
jgi:hypothetical protein